MSESYDVDHEGILHETDRALKFDLGDGESVWVPKSILEDHDDETFSVPEWWAVDKGLV